MNHEVAVRDRREALGAALSFQVAPEHYRDDIGGYLADGTLERQLGFD